MLWFFDRADESLTIETRYESGTSEFVFIARFPDGRERIERFTNPEAFGACLQALERQLAEEHWSNRGKPIILPHRCQDRPAQ
jgi:hypothetical protein